jgi:hypothetical protein
MAELAMLATLQPARAIMGFIAYDCFNSFIRVDACSLMELAAYPTTETPRGGEDHVWQDCPDEEGPIRAFVPLYSMVIKSMMSQYCRFNSAGGVIRNLTFR